MQVLDSDFRRPAPSQQVHNAHHDAQARDKKVQVAEHTSFTSVTSRWPEEVGLAGEATILYSSLVYCVGQAAVHVDTRLNSCIADKLKVMYSYYSSSTCSSGFLQVDLSPHSCSVPQQQSTTAVCRRRWCGGSTRRCWPVVGKGQGFARNMSIGVERRGEKPTEDSLFGVGSGWSKLVLVPKTGRPRKFTIIFLGNSK